MAMKVLFLNCTLKKSPRVSNTRALVDKAAAVFNELGVENEVIRVVDHNVAFGVSSDEGGGDEWPLILARIKACDILVIATPIWFGVLSSVAKMVIERLDGTYMEGVPETGQYPLYGKATGVIVTENEGGAHDVCSALLFNLTHMSGTVPSNADCYRAGDAEPGPNYIEAGGNRHLYTNRIASYMAHNLVYFAKLLRENPIPTNLKKLDKGAKKVSD
jgi:multimeric flavodoxin WrbA